MDMTFVSTCWVVERRTASKNEYASWEISYEEQGIVWVTEWDRALKFYDRASCEMLCRENPDDWDIRIMEHQIVDSPAEVKGRELTAENERLLRVVEQAIELGMIHADHFGIYSMAKAREVDTYPDLFAQLKGADRG
jgi:hypothetical protein